MLRIGSREVSKIERLFRLVDLGLENATLTMPNSPHNMGLWLEGVEANLNGKITDVLLFSGAYKEPLLADTDYHLLTADEEKAVRDRIFARFSKYGPLPDDLAAKKRVAIFVRRTDMQTIDEVDDPKMVSLGAF
jgi:hypothetical protein